MQRPSLLAGFGPALLLLCASALRAAPVTTNPPVLFNRDIRPILSDACFPCHGFDANKRKADLRLDTAEGLVALHQGRQAVRPGNPAQSELWRRVTATDPKLVMPPPDSGKKLPLAQIQLLRQWIEQGAPYQKHWAFEPPVRPPVPPVQHRDWPRNEVDRFILATLESRHLEPSPEAPKETLIRRLTLDLTGLPPTLAEVEGFLNDHQPDAYERVVDRLLASPHYGEHMARYWLDVARYGDTHGLHLDNERSLWPYRDWVVSAFNRNLSFDQFTLWQLAGDLLPHPTREQLVASGFNRCNVSTSEGGAIDEEFQVRYAVDRVETTSAAWLGLTMGCAVCHDHKLDPITQKEFYEVFSLFNNLSEKAMDGNALLPPPSLPLTTAEQETQLAELEARIHEAEQKLHAMAPSGASTNLATLTNAPAPQSDLAPLRAELQSLQKKREALEKDIPATMISRELDKPRPAWLLVRGQYDKHGEPVSPGVPAILPPLPKADVTNRLTFARWLVQPNHPLTARVTVNRFWQQFFGTGIVKTAEDFGTRGEWPSHPELLDWLATEFIRTGWDVKGLVRLLVTSATYRQDSRVPPHLRELDPENRLLARGPRYRLDAEELRDTALFLSGLLNPKMGGRGVRPYQPPGIWEAVGYTTSNTAHYTQDHGDALYRRSLYLFWKRTAPPPSMTTFDAPSREQCRARRERTNTPLQALLMMNDPQYFEAARQLGYRMLHEAGPNDLERLRYGFHLATARVPTDSECAILKETLAAQRARYAANAEAAQKAIAVGESPVPKDVPPTELAAYTMVANLLLNLDEVVTKN